jgi:hypothetical protein
MTAVERLWIDHVIWTRQVIVSSLAKLPDVQTALDRLLYNQEQLGAVFGSTRLATLLREHILISVALVGAAARGDRARASAENTRWHRNADELAAELHRLKPGLAEEDLRAMLYKHLALTTREATERIVGRWPNDVRVFDDVVTQAIEMADALQRGR